ncbi:GNAT family N-acetyltransferase [Legionella cincinnatiensis]|uniref:Acetyltransferase n=1 Tax=Legionella cincinnatiensis TaxID=28085 RepID=A0A378IJV0_9GAMM|nr:GNAT family N-acetyltransferase [Legionella cincinnatiensis]KTC83459.1 acetyltransferase [Legionella cincinnatiensis]STX35547.1 acetyltransferase [Legionella cincinnatiensis]
MRIIETERLILRTWSAGDATEYYRINQDPKVIEFLKGSLTMKEVRDFISCMNKQFDELGYTLWAAEEKAKRQFIGFIGLNLIKWEAPFGQVVEVGWRLGSQYWKKGYATEGAIACLQYGFNQCDLKEIVSFTVPANTRSFRVMEKIGMIRDLNGDFAHPNLPLDHRLSKHILYRISNKNYE